MIDSATKPIEISKTHLVNQFKFTEDEILKEI